MNFRYVVLTPSGDAVPEGYDVRLGPLAFVTPADVVSESVGDGLEAVGAALVTAERAPRPLKLKLPVRGYHRDSDPKEAGLRLRREVRAWFDNARWRLQGAYLVWDADEQLDGWLLTGSAEMSESDPGISFGEYDLDLADVFIVGRPGTHRPGRRARIGDRRTGMVARDTRRLLYSTDFNTVPLPDEPLVVPGDVVDLVASGNRPVDSVALGPLRDARRLWRAVAADDAEIVSYLPDEALLPGRERYLDLDDLGAVRVWDLSNANTYPPMPADYTPERDTDPRMVGWERVLGDVLTADRPLAIDNGVCRLVWLGPAANQGLAVEHWDDTAGHYIRAGRVLHALSVREQRVVELTPERAVVEWRAGQYGMRAILQRGWWGPRLESYDDGGGTARLEYAPGQGAPTVSDETPAWVKRIEPAGVVVATNRVRNPVPAAVTGYDDSSTYYINPCDGGGPDLITDTDGEDAIRFVTDASPGQQGVRYAGMTADTFENGVEYHFLVAVRALADGAASLFLGAGAADPGVSAQGIAVTTDYQVFSCSWTPSADRTGVVCGVKTPGGGAANTFFMRLLAVTTADEYFDGDTPGARWSGTPDASTSEMLEQEPVEMLWATGAADEVDGTAPEVITGPAVTFERDRVLVAQLAPPPGPSAAELAALSLVDARPIPVLVGRG